MSNRLWYADYTIQLGELIENNVDIGIDGTEDWNNGIEGFPIDSEAVYNLFCDKYMFREIGEETPARFAHRVRTRIHSLIPYYSQLASTYNLAKLIDDNNYHMLTTDDIKDILNRWYTRDDTIAHTGTIGDNGTSNVTETRNLHDVETRNYNDNETRNLTDLDTRNLTDTETKNLTDSTNITGSENDNNGHTQYFSDTPQSSVPMGHLFDETTTGYLTNATKDIYDNTHSFTNRNDTTTQTGTDTNVQTGTDTVTHTGTDNISHTGTINNDRTGTDKNDAIVSNTRTFDNTDDRDISDKEGSERDRDATRNAIGNTGNKYYQDVVEKAQDLIINFQRQIVDEFEDLFLQLY